MEKQEISTMYDREIKFQIENRDQTWFLGRIVHQLKQKLYLLRAQCMFITSTNDNQ